MPESRRRCRIRPDKPDAVRPDGPVPARPDDAAVARPGKPDASAGGGRAAAELSERLQAAGARACAIEADLQDTETPQRVLDQTRVALGPATALVLAHSESAESTILSTEAESFDRHFAVSTRAAWLLVREFARQFAGPHGTGRIIALTSDHTAGNLPYGASKGALDRIVIAAATELSHLGISANCINPGRPTPAG